MLFGGERDSQPLNEMWRFHFATEFWEKLSFPSPTQPMPRTQTTAFILSQFKTRGAVHFIGLHEQDYFGSQPDPEKANIATRISSMEKETSFFSNEDALYEEIDEAQVQNYEFAESDNCLVDSEDQPEVLGLRPSAKKMYDKLPGLVRRQGSNNFTRMLDQPPGQGQQPSLETSLKVKMSNLSKMSAYSNYSMFSNESNESLNVDSVTEPSKSSTCHSTLTESACESSLISPTGSSSIKMNFSLMKKSQSMISSSSSSKESSVGSVIAKDKSLQSFTQALIHQEEPKAENIYEVLNDHDQAGQKGLEMVEMKPSTTKRSDSSYTFQSYDCSSSRSSTLSSNPPINNNTNSRPLMGTRVLPPRNHRILDIETESNSAKNNDSSSSAYYSADEMSSISGYESIAETANINNKKNNSSNLTSFSNPNYLCPDAKTIVERKQQKNKFDETLVTSESHQNFAAALNSPAESLISDYHDFHARLHHDLVDLNPSQESLIQKPAVKITSFNNASMVRLRPKTTPVLPRRPRPMSSGLELGSKANFASLKSNLSDDESVKNEKARPHNEAGGEAATGGRKNQLNLLMFVLGGRVGQVTVFNGPISLWKLDLTKTF